MGLGVRSNLCTFSINNVWCWEFCKQEKLWRPRNVVPQTSGTSRRIRSLKHEESTKREREKKHDRSGFETPFSGGYSTSTNKEEQEFQMSDYSDSDWLYKVICFQP